MTEDLHQTLTSIRPTNSGGVMDLVASAGIDVTPWQTKADGSPVKNPRANPHYCYEWSFGGGQQPTALCVWHKDITLGSVGIQCADNLRHFALELDLVAIEQRNPSHVKSRARDQAKRARNFDSQIQRAFRNGTAVRVILLVGEDKGTEQLGWDTSKVKYRSLDNAPWYVHAYSDSDGQFLLVRDVALVSTVQPDPVLEPIPLYVDQFSIPKQQDRVLVETAVLPRSPEVRKNVLRRAKGQCEYCGTPGFQMANGAVYLETHHVIPLANDGPDVEWNMMAICPNNHRRVHYALERENITKEMVDKLASQQPQARELLTSMVNRLLNSYRKH